MIRKPFVGKKVVTGDPECCSSRHEKGSKGIIQHISNNGNSLRVHVGEEYWFHCRKCLGPRR